MDYHLILPLLLAANAFVHIIQGFFYGFNKKTIPVVIWGIILGVIGYLWLNPVADWVKWVTLIMPIVGGTGLVTQLSSSTNAKWIDYSILVLDVVTIGLMVYLLFL